MRLYLALASAGLAVPTLGALAGLFPPAAVLSLAAAPLLVHSGRVALRAYDAPREFLPAVRSVVLCYAAATGAFSLALALGGMR